MAELCRKCFIETWNPTPSEIARIVMSEDEYLCEGCMTYGPYVDHISQLKDMSLTCGMHYAEYWHAVHVDRTMSQDDFDEWFRGNCYQCKHMSEICMKN